jgi:hypothetical protein
MTPTVCRIDLVLVHTCTFSTKSNKKMVNVKFKNKDQYSINELNSLQIAK